MLLADADAGTWFGALSMILTAVFGYLGNELRAQVKDLGRDLKNCQDKHTTAEKAAAVALAKADGLEHQNGEQQGMINKLADQIISLVAALHRQGLSAGSGPHVPLPDTDEYPPLTDSLPKG